MSKGSILIYTSAAGQAAPLPGVTLTVTDAGGSVRARLVTDADGFAEAADLPALESQRDALTAQVQAQEQENAALAADIAEGATEDKMKEIAQEELGLISPNQRVFSVGN